MLQAATICDFFSRYISNKKGSDKNGVTEGDFKVNHAVSDVLLEMH